MTWRKMHIVWLALLLAPAAPTVVLAQTTGPAYGLTVVPAHPTTQDVVTLQLAGTWSDSCPPNRLRAEFKDGGIYIDMLLPGAEDGNTPACKAIKTEWQATTTIGPLPAGTYKVYARGVSSAQTGGYAKIGEFQVEAAGSMPDPNSAGTTSGQKPDEPPGPDQTKNLEPGDCVVLLDAFGDPNCQLEAGRCGTVLGRDGSGHAGMVLVSWHFFGWGLDERCTDGDGAPIAYPAQWAQWVDTREVRLAVCFDECGTLRQGQGECVLLETQDGRTFNLLGADRLSEKIGPAGQFHFGDRVRVWGLLQVTGRRPDSACFCPLQEGDVYGVIVMLNVPPRDDCEGRFEPGDRVVLLVDAPPGPDGKPMTALHCGAQGTVVYHDSARPQAGIFVSWDGFTKGLNADDYCPAPSPPCPPGSGWPVRCDQIGPCNEGRAACPGDRLTVDLSNHQVWLTRGPQCPGGKHTLTGYAYIGIGSSSELAVSANVTPCPGIGGKWKTSLSVDWVPAEEWTSIKVFVDVENIDLSDIPAGKDVLAAGIVMNY